jgi:Holliday junction resolvase
MPVPDRTSTELERILVHELRKAGWRVQRTERVGDIQVDFVIDRDGTKYVVELKLASEGRRDRLIPLLSQAILQAQAFARHFPEPSAPLAVVAARRVPASVAEQLRHFAEHHAPDVAIGVIDAEGYRLFVGPGLEGLDAKPSRSAARYIANQPLPDLFSDVNEWMLKVLVGRHLPETLISVPRNPIRNASQLAQVANVFVMSASRLVNQLANQGFLSERSEHLQIVRADELLERWLSASRQMPRDVPARWIIKKEEKQFLQSVAKYAAESTAELPPKSRLRRGPILKTQPRCCVGLFAAADALGLGFVRGVPVHLYLERLDIEVLQRLGYP